MPSAAVRKVELRYRLYARILDVVASIIYRSIPWIGMLGIVYFGWYRTIASLSGQMTFADVAIRFWSDFKVGEFVPYLFGACGVLYGIRSRRLRKDNIERMEARTRMLESQIDSRRSSSRLTPRGDTRPEDKA